MHGEVGDSGEVVGVHCVERQLCGDGDCRDERVVSPGGWFATRGAKARRDATESARGRGVEGQGVEVVFGLLYVGEPRRSRCVVSGDERSDAQLGEGDRGDGRVCGKHGLIGDSWQQDDGVGVKDPVWRLVHSEASRNESMSRRKAAGSTVGR